MCAITFDLLASKSGNAFQDGTVVTLANENQQYSLRIDGSAVSNATPDQFRFYLRCRESALPQAEEELIEFTIVTRDHPNKQTKDIIEINDPPQFKSTPETLALSLFEDPDIPSDLYFSPPIIEDPEGDDFTVTVSGSEAKYFSYVVETF